jgi:hypothetical protein
MTIEEKSIKLAKLGLSEPKEVYDELIKYRESLLSSASSPDWVLNGDDKLEAELIKRNEPLIDLGLAIAANSSEVIKTLWGKYDERDKKLALAIKVGILGGTNASAISKEELAKVLKGAYVDHYESDEMACSLLKNKRARYVIEELLKRQQPFDSISQDRFLILLHSLSKNECLNTDQSDMESPDFTYWGIRKGLFKVVTEAPVNKSWLYPLYNLLGSIQEPYYPKASDEFNFSDFVKNWRNLSDEGKSPIGGYYTNLSLSEEFLCLCACLFGYKVFPPGSELTNQEDIVYRCAYYSRATLSKNQVSKAINRDGSIFIFSAMYNDSLLLNKDARNLIESELDSNLTDLYKKRIQYISKKNKSFKHHYIKSSENNGKFDSDSIKNDFAVLQASVNVQSSSLNKLKSAIYGLVTFSVVAFFLR